MACGGLLRSPAERLSIGAFVGGYLFSVVGISLLIIENAHLVGRSSHATVGAIIAVLIVAERSLEA